MNEPKRCREWVSRRAVRIGVLSSAALLLQAGIASRALAAIAESSPDMQGGTVGGSYPSASAPDLTGVPVPGMVGICAPPQLNTLGSPLADDQSSPQMPYYIQPSIGLGEAYSDNITLAPNGRKRSDSATVLSPGLSACTVGSRLYARFDYTGQAIRYAQNPPDNKMYNQVEGTLKADLYSDHLFLDTNTTYGQAVINPSAVYSTNNIFATTSNRTNFWASTYSPYWQQELGSLGLATLRYSYGRVVYPSNVTQLSNSQSWTKSFLLRSPSTNVDWSWTANWQSTRVKYHTVDRSDYFDTASLQLGYQLFYDFKLLATGGVETDYKPDGTVQRYGSRFWNAGFQWASQHSLLEVLYGHRFFGHSWLVHANYHTRAWVFRTAYTETPIANSLLQTQTAGVQSTALLSSLTAFNSLQNTNVFLDKRWDADISYAVGRSRLVVSAFDDRRSYRPESLGKDRITGLGVDWHWQTSEQTSIDSHFDRQRVETRTSTTGADFVNVASIALNYALTRNAQLLFEVNRQTGESYVAANQYTANGALVQMTAFF